MDSSSPFTPPTSSYTVDTTILSPPTPPKMNKKRQMHEVIEISQMISLSSDDTPSPQPALKKNKQRHIHFMDKIIEICQKRLQLFRCENSEKALHEERKRKMKTLMSLR